MSNIVKADDKRLAKAAKESEKVRAVIDASPLPGMREGSFYIDSDGDIYRVDKLKFKRQLNWNATQEAWEEKHPKEVFSWAHNAGKITKKDHVFIDDVLVEASRSDEWNNQEFRHADSHLLISQHHNFKNWVKIPDPETYKNLAQDIIEGKTEMPSMESELGEDQTESASGLIHVSSKEYLAVVQQAALEKAEHFKAIQYHVHRELEIKQAHLRGIMSGFRDIVAAFEKKVMKIKKLIHIIELYLGINEDILHFQEGPTASVDEPICFRQKIMFMDEEVGDPRLDLYGDDKGLDFRNIEAFDDWLCANGNYKKVIPESKCICVFKVRRSKKDHSKTAGENPFVLSWMEQEDEKTYILIRNGDNLYRIWVDLEVADRLFPHRDEMMKLQHDASEANGDYFRREDAKKALESNYERYQRQFILLQGFIDRTEILHPMKETFKLASLDLDKTKLVRFIYDDGPSLVHKDHVPFEQWTKVLGWSSYAG